MQFGAIIIGDEIMSGKRQDKHMATVISTLRERGLELSWCQYLADEPALITATLKRTFTAPELSTPVDLTPVVPEIANPGFAGNTTLAGNSDFYVANRGNGAPGLRNYNLGLRLARSYRP